MYSINGSRSFDVDMMERIYEHKMEVIECAENELPDLKVASKPMGGFLDGCRIGFDLGASDYKVAAVIDGKEVYSDEFPWDPKTQPDPRYHYEKIIEGIKKAKEHLPKLDAVGGSSAGVLVDNRIMVASLFRAIPLDKFNSEVKDIFNKIGKELGVPLEVINDGDVTALAGALSLKENGILGVAMGSSVAAGYIDSAGHVTGWLNELAFTPVDYNENAATDEWSEDYGVGARYFSQQAVEKLIPVAKIDLPVDMPLPEKLVEVQKLMTNGDSRARDIYTTIGVYLGYEIPHYAHFYDFKHFLILGRVTSGEGGEIIIRTAKEILKKEFPELAKKIQLHVPDEKNKRVGQAIAAASLTKI